MSDTTTNEREIIYGLLAFLDANCRPGYRNLLTALVAERDALRTKEDSWKSAQKAALVDIDKADAERVAELEAQPPAASDRDLRERLVESALRGAGTGAARSVRSSMLTEAEAEALGRQAVWMADGAFDEMRKGATDGK